jgi:hypothetical protein
MNIKSLGKILWTRSPANNAKLFLAKLTPFPSNKRNDIIDPLIEMRSFSKILSWSLSKISQDNILFLGDVNLIKSWQIDGDYLNKNILIKDWDWLDVLDEDYSGLIVLCRTPYESEHWERIFEFNSRQLKVSTLGELVAPFLQISSLMNQLDYHSQSMDSAFSFYLGDKFFGPLEELNVLFPLAGKRVVEFGCFDGFQTLGLCHLGAELTCIEARGDNAVKTRAALNALGFNATILMDDFHNAHSIKYGRFDLAFAHGVYYHSVAPFVFLENLITLSDSIFIGGFCATDSLPNAQWETLQHNGESYRAKPYIETIGITAGINKNAWLFDKHDLMRFFSQRGFLISIVSDELSTVTAGNFLRFLAIKNSG